MYLMHANVNLTCLLLVSDNAIICLVILLRILPISGSSINNYVIGRTLNRNKYISRIYHSYLRKIETLHYELVILSKSKIAQVMTLFKPVTCSEMKISLEGHLSFSGFRRGLLLWENH